MTFPTEWKVIQNSMVPNISSHHQPDSNPFHLEIMGGGSRFFVTYFGTIEEIFNRGMVLQKLYPLVNIQKAIESCHRNSGFTH